MDTQIAELQQRCKVFRDVNAWKPHQPNRSAELCQLKHSSQCTYGDLCHGCPSTTEAFASEDNVQPLADHWVQQRDLSRIVQDDALTCMRCYVSSKTETIGWVGPTR
eukprot:4559477-Amphidinium_carterae.2